MHINLFIIIFNKKNLFMIKYFLIIVLNLLPLLLYAQSIKIGLSGGINYSIPSSTKKYSDPYYDSKSMICPTIRENVFISINDYLSIQTGLSFTQYGYKIKGNPQYYTTLNYLDILTYLNINHKSFFFSFGSILGMYINGKTHFESYDYCLCDDIIKPINFGLSLGLGYVIPIGKKYEILLQTSYTHNITKIYKLLDNNLKMNGISFSAGIYYNI